MSVESKPVGETEPVGESERVGEFELIERFFTRRSSRSDVLLGIGDDAALLHLPADTDLVVAVDTAVAGRHFPMGCAPQSIGHRVMAVNLSDMAAMGATPAWATLALTLPVADPDWLHGFADGLMSLAALHGVSLVGGDTTAGPLTLSVQILGHVARGTALRRSGGQEGDLLVVTGSLGDAGAGLAFATQSLVAPDRAAGDELLRRFEYPTPRVAFGSAARGIASAAMDLSDGLVGDLPKLAASSGLSAHVEVDRLPLSPALKALGWEVRAREWALGAGDDYELLLAVPRHRFDDLVRTAARLDLELTAIGELRRGMGVHWTLGGEAFTPATHGYDHFL